ASSPARSTRSRSGTSSRSPSTTATTSSTRRTCCWRRRSSACRSRTPTSTTRPSRTTSRARRGGVANFLVWVVWVLAAFACVASALGVVSFRNPFFSALALIGNLASLAVLYLLLGGEFVAAAQVLVYGGAVMVMFLFVIAYLGDRTEQAPWAGGPSW